VRASCRLPLPPAQLLSRLHQSPNAVRSRNPSESTLAHDAVAAAVSHKHHSIIRVGAGLIQFVYKSHSRLATELTLDKVLFSLWISRAFPYLFHNWGCLFLVPDPARDSAHALPVLVLVVARFTGGNYLNNYLGNHECVSHAHFLAGLPALAVAPISS